MKRKVILVVDDDARDVETVRRLLKEAKVLNQIESVPDGAEAIAYLQRGGKFADRSLYPPPALLFLDLVMPQRSGLSVLRWIKDRPKSSLPAFGIIAMTYVGNTEGIQQAYSLGAHSFLMKPLVLEELANLLNGLKGIRLEPSENGRFVDFDAASIK